MDLFSSVQQNNSFLFFVESPNLAESILFRAIRVIANLLLTNLNFEEGLRVYLGSSLPPSNTSVVVVVGGGVVMMALLRLLRWRLPQK